MLGLALAHICTINSQAVFAWVGKTACWRMPKISGNLDTPHILSVFPNSNPSFYVRILHLCDGEDNFMDYAMVSNARVVSEALCV